MKILFFDTETIGLPKDYKASYEDVEKWPRIMSLAWELADENGTVESSNYSMIKPDGWVVPAEKFWIDNGYSTERSEKEGLPILEVLTSFMADIVVTDVLVAHNLNFDHRITWAELIRAGITPRSGLHKIDTMIKATSHCKIPNPKGSGYKWPKLEEMYRSLFGKDFEGAHNALADVQACREGFFELVRLGVIQLPDLATL